MDPRAQGLVPGVQGRDALQRAQAELDEGPRLTSDLVGAGDRATAIGQRVEVAFTNVDTDLTSHAFRIVDR